MQFKKEVVSFTVSTSNRAAATRFGIEPKRVREWRNIIDKIETIKSNKERLEGSGRKCNDGELEEELVLWIHEMQSKMLHVSRKMIMFKAKKMMDEKNTDPATQDSFLQAGGDVKNL